MRSVEFGRMRQWAIEHQIKVGQYFGVDDFVPVIQAHIMADTGPLGVAGVECLEHWGGLPPRERSVRIPTITVLDAAKGGVATAWMLHEIKARGCIGGSARVEQGHSYHSSGMALAALL
jgi:hypothetical protein